MNQINKPSTWKTAIVGVAACMAGSAGTAYYMSEKHQEEPVVTTEQADTWNGSTVFFTPKGKRYHIDRDCSSLKRSRVVREVEIDEARDKGLTPCHVCSE